MGYFEYELRGRRFRLITDYKAFEEIRKKSYFKVNRWIEKIQEFDFLVEYCKGEELAVLDTLIRLYESKVRVRRDHCKSKSVDFRTDDVDEELVVKNATVIDG